MIEMIGFIELPHLTSFNYMSKGQCCKFRKKPHMFSKRMTFEKFLKGVIDSRLKQLVYLLFDLTSANMLRKQSPALFSRAEIYLELISRATERSTLK